jgi:hypothetical protein
MSGVLIGVPLQMHQETLESSIAFCLRILSKQNVKFLFIQNNYLMVTFSHNPSMIKKEAFADAPASFLVHVYLFFVWLDGNMVQSQPYGNKYLQEVLG